MSGVAKDLASALVELEKSAESRYEEREEKRMRMFLDAEEIRRKACAEEEERHRQEERKHEERMQYMFLSFMQQICQSRATPYTPSASHHASLNVPGFYGPGSSNGGLLYPPSSPNMSLYSSFEDH